MGYVREEDWGRLGDAGAEIPLSDENGEPLDASITAVDMVLGPDGLERPAGSPCMKASNQWPGPDQDEGGAGAGPVR
jgi:hypothetical protein